ncbi:MAG: hypothetical protein WD226_07615 [Planctomycetota bacterium]
MNSEPLNHDELVDLLPLWIGGDLDESTADRVAAAVADSDELSERAEELAATRRIFVDGLASALRTDPAPDLWPGVRVALAADGVLAPAVSPGESARVLAFPWRRVAAAAALLVSAALLWTAAGEWAAPDEPTAAGESTAMSERLVGEGGDTSAIHRPAATHTVADVQPADVQPADGSRAAPGGLVPLGPRASQRDASQLLYFVGDGPADAALGTGTRLVSDVR